MVLTYNQNNRLIRVEEDSVILVEYTYNGLGQRIIKEADGATTIFHYDFDGNIIGESDTSGNFSKEYPYRGTSRLALVDVSTEEIYYYGNDQLGTPQILTDSTNTVVWEAVYKPFGEADVNPNSSVVNNFRFPGQYYDSETDLYYNYHRYYDPSTGRYLTPDPIELAGGINLYLYANGNPINEIDPFGLYTREELANIIFNETESLSGKGIYDARVAIGNIAENRYIPGVIDTGIASPQLTKRAQAALTNKVPSVVAAYEQAKKAAAAVLDPCEKDTTKGAKGFVIKGDPLRPERYGKYPVLQQFGPFKNSFPTAGNPNVPVTQQLPATGIYINIFAQ
jgi:RHS repeat-associated protein